MMEYLEDGLKVLNVSKTFACIVILVSIVVKAKVMAVKTQNKDKPCNALITNLTNVSLITR